MEKEQISHLTKYGKTAALIPMHIHFWSQHVAALLEWTVLSGKGIKTDIQMYSIHSAPASVKFKQEWRDIKAALDLVFSIGSLNILIICCNANVAFKDMALLQHTAAVIGEG